LFGILPLSDLDSADFCRPNDISDAPKASPPKPILAQSPALLYIRAMTTGFVKMHGFPSIAAQQPRARRQRLQGHDRMGGGQFKTAWAHACAEAGLPGQWFEGKRPDRPSARRRFVSEYTPHGLRHTWASWHYCVHRDLLRPKEEGGWEVLGMVERYAKRVPATYTADIEDWWAGRVDLGLAAAHLELSAA
jgi:hypothetical protein